MDLAAAIERLHILSLVNGNDNDNVLYDISREQ